MQILTQESLDFLLEVREKNSKTWFADNKERYTNSLLLPLQKIVSELRETMYEIDPEFELLPMVDKTISRIYRDTRFSKDKSLYKDRMWITFKKSGKDKLDYPAFFLEISPYGYRYGMGFFQATTISMNAIRESIDRKSKQFMEIIEKINQKRIFLPEGEAYKKNIYQDKIEELQQWYNRKNIYVVYNSDNVNELFSDSFIDILKEGYQSLSELYMFFGGALKAVQNERK